MFIPDPNSFHPGSEFFPSRIRVKEFKYFNPKKLFLSSRNYDPGCSSRMDPDILHIPDPERQRNPDPPPQHCVVLHFLTDSSVADLGCFSRIQVFFSSKIPDPTSTKIDEEKNLKRNKLTYLFCSHKFHKIVNYFNFFLQLQKKCLSQLTKS
jgi:hypothetical protein